MVTAFMCNNSKKSAFLLPPSLMDRKIHYKFACSIITPVIISFLFMIVHWLRIESTVKKRLKSLPFLILQIWPQIQVCKILKMGLYDKNLQWRKRKDSMDRDVSSVGKKFL